MSWQYSDAPNHIAPEVGPSLLTGDGPWSGVVLEPGAVYALSVEVNAPGETTVGWGVAVTDGSGGEYVLADPADTETVPGGQWVTVTRNLPAPAFPTTATVTLAVPAGTQARNPSMGVLTGRTVLTVPGDVLAENIMASGGIIAGDPDGARVELTDQGLVSYDATGTETASISGEGGEFVGGKFRTSDTLPGQVALADDAYVDSAGGTRRPGISVIPVDTSNMATPPGIGASGDAILVNGGRNLAGGRAHLAMSPGGIYGEARLGSGQVSSVSVAVGETRLRSNGPNGDYGWARAQPGQAELAYIATDNTYFSRIRADANEAHLYTRAGGVTRSLTIDKDGMWVRAGSRSYNLEGTTWNTLSLGNGWQAYTGGGGYFNGLRAQRTPLGIRLDGMIQGGGVGQVAALPATMQDVAAKQFPVVTQSGPGVMGIHRRSSDGWWVVSYLSGPATPGWISVSVDAALA